MYIISGLWEQMSILHIWYMITEHLLVQVVSAFIKLCRRTIIQVVKRHILNMYTAPEYRRQGIAFHTLDLLVKDAKKQGVSQIALEATDMGRPLYEKYGFVKMEDEMVIKQYEKEL